MARIDRQKRSLGTAFKRSVARNVPPEGKLGIRHCLQSYVELSLPVLYEDAELAIYILRKHDHVVDETRDFISRHDARRGAQRASPRRL